MGQVQNPNWPRISDVIDFYDSRGTPIAGCLTWVDVTKRGRGTMSAIVGRNYETDSQRAGELKQTLDNYDSAFDPTNTNSPFYPLVKLRRPMRRLAQYPVNANLLTPDQATAGSYSAAADGTMIQAAGDTANPGPGSSLTDTSGFLYVSSDTNSAGVRLTTVTDGPNSQCPNCYQVPLTAGQTGNAVNIWVPVVPGQQYTLQWRVRCTTGGQSPQVAARIRFLGSGGPSNSISSTRGSTVTLTGGVGTWSTITVTATAPTSGVFGMALALAVITGASGACTLQGTACQVEDGATAGTWALPGQVYSIITAYNERLPQDYQDAGTFSLTAVTASDFLAFLNQGGLLDAIGSTVMEYAPSFYYRLDDQQGSTAAVDAAGFRQAAPLLSAPNAASVTFGTTVTAATPSVVPQGTDGSCAHFTNTTAAFTGIDLTCGGIYPAGPGGGSATSWSRAVTFRCSTLTTAYQTVWASYDSQGGVGNNFSVAVNGNAGGNTLTIAATIDGHGTRVTFTGSNSICDGNWHTVLVSVNSSGTCTIYEDDVAVATATGLGGTPGTFVSDFIGAERYVPSGVYQHGFTGDIAHVAEWPVAISPSNGWGMYEALVPAYAGDSASDRWTRLLRMASNSATYRASSSVTSTVAPMTDTDGNSPFDAMDRMVVTENGDHFISGWGIPTFRARSDRYNTAPVAVFGENSSLGELPYENPVGFDYDDARIASQVQVTQQPSGMLYTATDTRNPLPYGPARMTRVNYATSGTEVQASASYLLARYQDPHLRLRSITVHPGANPALWPACLALMIGSRVRVMRRPIGANPITFDGFVEKLSWSFPPGDAILVIQMSPADTQTYWILGGPNAPGTTTLTANSLVGATSLSANGMAAGTMANAGFVQGQPIIVGSGTANAELATINGPPSTVVVSVFGGQVVFSTTVPVTALTKTHSNGDTIAIAGAVAGGGGSLAAYSVLDSTTRLAY